MTPADTTALAVLGVFAAIAVFGGLRWLFRCAAGLAVGCAVLVALSYSADVPPPRELGRFVRDSRIVRAITERLESHHSAARQDDDVSR